MGFLDAEGLVSKGDPVSISPENRVVVTTSVDIYDSRGRLVGYCTGCDETETRQTKLIRPLSWKNPGKILDQVPQNETVTLRVTGFSLYNDDLMSGELPHYSLINRLYSAVGTQAFKSIRDQRIPFDLKYVEVHPGVPPLIQEITGPVSQWEVRGWKPTQSIMALNSMSGRRVVKYYRKCFLTTFSKPVSLGGVTISETVGINVSYVDGPVGQFSAQSQARSDIG